MKIKILIYLYILCFFNTVSASEIIKIGIDENFPPYEYVDDKGNPAGFNVDLIQHILDQYGYSFKFIAGSWESVYRKFKNNELHVIPMFYSKTRSQHFLLSVPHNTVTYSIFKNKENEKYIDHIDHIVEFVVISNDILHEVLLEKGVPPQSITAVSNAKEALDIVNNNVDRVALVPKIQGLYFIRRNNFDDVVLTRELSYMHKYCFGLNADDKKLLYRINEGMAASKETGLYDKLYVKWFFPLKGEKKVMLLTLKQYYPLLIAIIILIIVLAVWSFFLRREVKKRHNDLISEIHARERSEMAIIESEERFRTLAENSPAAILIFNEKKIFFINNSALALFDISHESLSQRYVPDFFDKTHEDFFKYLFENKIHKSELLRQTFKIVQDGGAYKWVDMSFVRSYYKAEPVFIATGFDTTSRKLYEDEILESRRSFSTLLSNLPGMAYRSLNNKEWTMLFVSHGCLKITGYTYEELLHDKNHAYVNLIHPEDRNDVWEKAQEKISDDKPFKIEYRIITKDNKIKWVSEQGRLIKSGDEIFLEGYIEDITDVILSKEALKEERNQLEITLNSIGDGFICTDNEGLITMMNPIAEKLTGWPLKEALGQSLEKVFNIINESTREKCANPVDEVLKDGQIIELSNHTVLLSKDGSEYIISDSAAPIKDKSGLIKGVVLVFSDHTDKKKSQIAIEKSEAKLKATLKAIPDFIFRNRKDGMFTDFIATSPEELLISPDQIIGTMLDTVFDKKFADNLVKAIQTCIETGETQFVEYFIDQPSERLYYEARIVKFNENEALSVCRNITKRKIAEDKINQNLNQQYLLANISTVFNSNESFDRKIEQVFESLGLFFDVDRVYLMENFDDNKYCKNTYEWVSKTGLKQKEYLQRVDYQLTPTLSNRFKEDDIFMSHNIEEDLYGEELKFFQQQDIKAIIVIPVKVEEQFWGSIGFDECKNERKWTSSEVEFLRTVSNVVAAAIERELNYVAIQKEREQLETTLYSIGDGVIATDTKGCVTMINKVAEIMIGYKSDEAIGKHIRDVFRLKSEAGDTILQNPIEMLLETGSNPLAEERTVLIGNNGMPYHISHGASLIKDNENHIFGAILVFRDVTEKRRIENLIKQSEENYRKLFEFANDPIIIIKDNKFVNCNNKTYEVFGYSREEIIGKSLSLFSPESQPDGQDSLEKAVSLIKNTLNGEETYCEWEHQKKDGTLFMTEISLSRTEIKNEHYVLVIIRDISVRKAYEKALAESEEKYKTLVENANDGIAIAQDGRFVFVNKWLCELTGYSYDEFIGKEISHFLGPSSKELARKFDQNWLMTRRNEPNIYEVLVVQKSGKKMQMEVNANFIHIKGKPAAIAVIRNVQERKEFEAKLRQFKATIENSTDAIGMSTPDGIHVYQNKSFDTLFGPIKPDKPKEIYKDKKVREQVFETIMSGGQWIGEVEMISAQGEILNIFLRAYATFDEDGEIAGLVGIHTDITDEMRYEEELEKSEEKLRMLLDMAADAFFQGDENGNLITVNDEAVKLTQYSKEELLAFNIKDLFEPETLNKQPLRYDVLEKGVILKAERNLKCRNGAIIPIEMKSRKMPDGTYQSFFRDISERKQSEDILKVLLNISQIGEKSINEIIHYALKNILTISQSHKACMFFVDDNGAIFRKQMYCQTIPDCRNKKKIVNHFTANVQGLIADTIKKREAFIDNQFNDVLALDDTAPETFDKLMIVPVTDAGVVRMVLILTDKIAHYNENDAHQINVIADRLWKTVQSIKNNEFIRKLNIELLEKNREMEQFVYITSHDLRSPLVNIQGFTKELINASKELIDLIHEDDNITRIRKKIKDLYQEDMNESLNYITLSAQKMDTLLNGLLKLSRLGKIVPQIKTVNMNSLMNDTIDSFEFQLTKKNIKVDVQDLHNCKADEILLSQAFSNIIDNAIKHNDKEFGEINISSRDNDDKIVYCIQDNGPGISCESLKKVFEIFYRINTQVDGEGLGLSIAHKIVEKNNGKIWVESEIGVGTNFFIALEK